MNVIVCYIGFDNMERWVQEFSLLEAFEQGVFGVGLQYLGSILRAPDEMIFKLVDTVVQSLNSHGYSLAHEDVC